VSREMSRTNTSAKTSDEIFFTDVFELFKGAIFQHRNETLTKLKDDQQDSANGKHIPQLFNFSRLTEKFFKIKQLALDKKTGYCLSSQEYLDTLYSLYDFFVCATNLETIEMAKVIRQLMLTASDHLLIFKSKDKNYPFTYEKISTRTTSFIEEWIKTKEAEIVVKRFTDHFESIDFEKLKNELTAEVKKPYWYNFLATQHSIEKKLENLSTTNIIDQHKIIKITYDFVFKLKYANNIIYENFILKSSHRNDTDEKKYDSQEYFKILYDEKSKGEIEKRIQEYKIKKWFDRFPYNFARLKEEIIRNINEENESFFKELRENPDKERRDQIIKRIDFTKKIKSAIACVGNIENYTAIKKRTTQEIKDPNDAFNITQLALLFVNNGGSKIIFSLSRKPVFTFPDSTSEEDQKNYYYSDFKKNLAPFIYDAQIANQLLNPPGSTGLGTSPCLFPDLNRRPAPPTERPTLPALPTALPALLTRQPAPPTTRPNTAAYGRHQ
jgi:hypothetical protein